MLLSGKRNKYKHQFLLVAYELDFENAIDTTLAYGVVNHPEEDLGLAMHQMKERVSQINKQIPEKYLFHVMGYYHGGIKTHDICDFKQLTPNYCMEKINEILA